MVLSLSLPLKIRGCQSLIIDRLAGHWLVDNIFYFNILANGNLIENKKYKVKYIAIGIHLLYLLIMGQWQDISNNMM